MPVNKATPQASLVRRGLKSNMLWNLAGQVLPLAAALFAVPVLIAQLGLERFGVLTIAWMVIGYFGLFDLGVGRAVTKLVAERLGSGRDSENPALIWTALALMFALGLVAAACLALLTPWLTGAVLKIPAALLDETRAAFYILAASVPVVFVTAALRAVLEAHQRFDLANLIRVPMGVWSFAGPLAVLPFDNGLDALVCVLLAGRVAAMLAFVWACTRERHGFLAACDVQPRLVGRLLSFGGWITVSNIVGPVMVYFDRFVIGALLGMTAVAYYTTPYEVVVKLGILPDAIVSVLFPAFAATIAAQPARAVQLFERGLKVVLLLVLPATLLVAVLAYDALRLWVGPAFAAESYRIAQWLCAGIVANAMAKIPYAAVQASGRPDLTAKAHLAELPLYLAGLWALVHAFGIQGAAAAWALRALVDLVLMLWFARRLLPVAQSASRALVHVGGALAVIAAGSMLPSFAARAIFIALVLCAFAWFAWRVLLGDTERAYLAMAMKLAPSRKPLA